MNRFVQTSIALLAGFTMLEAAFAAEPAGIDALTAKDKERGILTADGAHLNAAGNKFVATQAAQAITTALNKETAATTSDSKSTSLFNGKDLTGWHIGFST